MDPNALYYQDSHLHQFHAHVISCQPQDGLWAVGLDQTAFYPEGGGQPWDLGTLADAQVLAVREQDGAVVHFCDRPLNPGQAVQGQIDWPRRFDLMQQHSGEHMLSGVIHRRYGFHNVGFHMGAASVTIDFDGVIPQEDLPGLEAAVNDGIWQDLPIRTWCAGGDALADSPYRSKRPLEGLVRLVEIPGYDLCACCGTHVKRTGEIGLLKLLSWARFHQGVRMEMVCGRRVTHSSQIYHQNRMVSQTFSAKPLETGAAAQRMAQELETCRACAGRLEARLFAAARIRSGRRRRSLFETLSPDGVRRMADANRQRLRRPLLRVFRGRWKRIPLRHVRPLRRPPPLDPGQRPRFSQSPAFACSLPASRRDIEAYFHANLFHSLGE